LNSKQRILNQIVSWLEGGRDKSGAAKAYDFFKGDLQGTGLSIRMPETIRDVSKAEIPLWVRHFGGQAVVKIPYSNAGQGVFTIVNQHELDAFMEMEFSYERFIVQSLIGNYEWLSKTKRGKFYNVGTIRNEKGETQVCDLRVMLESNPTGLRPIRVYGRRAAKPLADSLKENAYSLDMLGTNLSVKQADGSFISDSSRLMLMVRRDFNKLLLSLDDLIEGYIQTVLSTLAIDRLAKQLYNKQGKFRKKLFKSLNDDQSLIDEIMVS